jgi:hypothetical protein
MIVVVLIAVLYGVFISRMTQSPKKNRQESVTIETLKQLLEAFPASQKREIICLEPCTECRIYLDGKAVKGTSLSLFNAPPAVLVRDRYGQFVPKRFLPLDDPKNGIKDVCFRYRLFRNGSASSYIVQTESRAFYLFRPYLYPVKRVDSLEDAVAAFDTEKLLPTERRNYNF